MRRHAVSTGRPDAMLGVILLLQTLTLAIAGPATSPEYLPLRVAEAEADPEMGHDSKALPLVPEGRARVLVDLRTPAAVAQALGSPTVNAAVFVRADRRPRDRDLAAFARAVLAAEQRLATAPAEELAAKLGKSVLGAGDEFAGRVEAARAMYLADGLVSAEQVKQTIALIRSPQPP